MSTTNDFDRFFLHLPPFDKEKNFNQFWTNALKEMKSIPIEPHYERIVRKSSMKYDFFSVTFKGSNRSTVSGDLYYPRGTKRAKVIILIHDYNSDFLYNPKLLIGGMAYFYLRLRGHDILEKKSEEEATSPGYIIDNILEKENYYIKEVYLDAYRTIDALRLNNKLDCSDIGIIGKGLGAALAIFTAAFSERVKALVLDTPSFSYLPLYQNVSTSDATNEINEFIANHKAKKNQVKKNLTYYDAINFADMIRCPVLAIVGFKDTISPPECVFALFNHLLTDKTIEVYPDEGNSAGGDEQFIKSLQWMRNVLGTS